MIVDSSAIVAILKSESDAETFSDVIIDSSQCAMVSATLVETAIVIDGLKNDQLSRDLDTLLADYPIRVLPFTAEMALVAREAFRRFGKGMGHPAKLNFGGCIAYAAAKTSHQRLLFKGDDFTKTDIEPALERG